jgi:Flp pilus assembly protein TadG
MRPIELNSKSLNETRGLAARRRASLCSESGQSLLEVALLTPLLLLLLVGVIELGRFAYFGILVGNAARAGVAYGAQNAQDADDPTGLDIPAAVCNDFQQQSTCGLSVSKAYLCQCDNGGTIGASINCTTTTCPVGQREVVALQVTAAGTFTPLFNMGFSSITVTRTATQRIE